MIHVHQPKCPISDFPKLSNSCAAAHISPSRHHSMPIHIISPFSPTVCLGLPLRPTLLNTISTLFPPFAQVSLSAFQWDLKGVSHIYLLQSPSHEKGQGSSLSFSLP